MQNSPSRTFKKVSIIDFGFSLLQTDRKLHKLFSHIEGGYLNIAVLMRCFIRMNMVFIQEYELFFTLIPQVPGKTLVRLPICRTLRKYVLTDKYCCFSIESKKPLENHNQLQAVRCETIRHSCS